MVNHRIDSAFTISCIDQPLSISATLQTRVDRIWDEEKQQKGEALFDGLILSAIEVTHTHLVGRWVNYRYALAVYRQPDLSDAYQVNPVAVNGVTLAGSRVLLAKRAGFVSQSPGCWEFVPSGGIDPKASSGGQIDYRRAILDELEEETGIDRGRVARVDPFALIYDPLTSTWEMALQIRLDDDRAFSLASSEEYEEFTWVDKGAVQAFLERYSEDEVVPLTRVISGLVQA